MKDIVIHDFGEIHEIISHNLERDKSTAFICKYDDAVEILFLLFADEFICPVCIDLEDPDCAGYEDEFFINIDTDYGFSCLKLRDGEKISSYYADKVYLFDDCGSKCVSGYLGDANKITTVTLDLPFDSWVDDHDDEDNDDDEWDDDDGDDILLIAITPSGR